MSEHTMWKFIAVFTLVFGSNALATPLPKSNLSHDGYPQYSPVKSSHKYASHNRGKHRYYGPSWSHWDRWHYWNRWDNRYHWPYYGSAVQFNYYPRTRARVKTVEPVQAPVTVTTHIESAEKGLVRLPQNARVEVTPSGTYYHWQGKRYHFDWQKQRYVEVEQ
ncbi:hypothetical protein [Paraferrimonas haliotis]|uniref:Uncharacterized protein n=1 Tax=Paraferrimonas haliotis TaxID=2013866 RepID=A0AA37TJD8_9GAMM|nr:hypothetical protein [Paraferrimonas haliotis]GLS82274.1 hypothetical protein GCM10007894_02510 [Paraferrimonas haliotis]